MIGFGNMAEPDFCTHFPAMLPRNFRPQAAWGTGVYPSKRVCHTNALLAPTPPQAALALLSPNPSLRCAHLLFQKIRWGRLPQTFGRIKRVCRGISSPTGTLRSAVSAPVFLKCSPSQGYFHLTHSGSSWVTAWVKTRSLFFDRTGQGALMQQSGFLDRIGVRTPSLRCTRRVL